MTLLKVSASGLEVFLRSLILMRGPLSVADFMKHALGHPQYGYYMREHAIFGTRGDFVTSPEVSQMFGELIAVWFAYVLQQNHVAGAGPGGFRFIELGPGRGTLASDALRAFQRLPATRSSLRGVHLVETSRALRHAQAQTLVARNVRLSSREDEGLAPEPADVVQTHAGAPSSADVSFGQRSVGVSWSDRLADVPADMPCCILAHELFDALPTHQFVWCADLPDDAAPASGRRGAWRERLIDVDEGTINSAAGTSGPTGGGFRVVRAPGPTPASAAFSLWRQRLVTKGFAREEVTPDAVEEYSPTSCSMAHEISHRVAAQGGAALVIDYGYDRRASHPTASVRGIRGHQFVDMLQDPGLVDLSADVDFASLAECASDSGDAVKVHGPVSQGAWLQEMGISARLERLLHGATNEDTARRLVSEAERLVHPEQMGSVYKFVGITSASGTATGDTTTPGFMSTLA